MVFYIVCIFLIIVLLIILSFVWPPDSPWSPWWRVNAKNAKALCKYAKINSRDIVYELGSGDAEFIIAAAKHYGAKTIGIEIDPLRYYISKVRVFLIGIGNKVTLYKKNFYDVDVSSTTIVFVYLVPRALERLLPKLKKELKKGTKIISYRYKIPLDKSEKRVKLTSENKKLNVFVYQVV